MMEYKDTAAVSIAVITSLVALVESKGLDLNNVEFSLESRKDGEQSAQVNFKDLIDATLISLHQLKNHEVNEDKLALKEKLGMINALSIEDRDRSIDRGMMHKDPKSGNWVRNE